ncbi:putative DNA binding domain-containing protein, partial [Colwellia sp. D2M02]|uniref:RNA-binding domain-containing protein n=1 Tax=Colwellia sp. D2M02 TaxID=2841562 RepID=UPI001C08F2DC
MLELSSLEDISILRESSEIECKLAGGKDGKGEVPKDMWESYSAFANTDGGYIILGLREKKGSFTVEGIENIHKVRGDIVNTANSNKVSCNLLSNKSIEEIEIDGKLVLVISVRRATRTERPVHLNSNPFGHTYRRKWESDEKLNDEQVRRMIAEQVEESRDNKVLKNFGFEELDSESLKIYRQAYSNLNPGAPWNDLNDLEFLRRIGAWRIDRETGNQGLTVAGLLMFGTHYVIQEQFPYYMLDYQERPEAKTERRWVDRLTLDGTWSGNLYDFYRKTYRKLTSDLKVPFEIKGGIRQDDTPIHVALREALANVLVHADYSDRASVLVVKRPDMFGFRNPGQMRVPVKVAMRGGEADCRNRTLHQMFRYVNIGEQAGSGIPKILAGWKNQSWQQPLIRELLEPYDQTILELKMVDLFPSQITDKLKENFGDKFTELNELERLITVLVYGEYYISHKELCQLSSAHTREVTLALVRLERMGIIGSTGTHRNKVYHSPENEIPTPDNSLGQFIADNLFITKPLSDLERSMDKEINPEINPELNP